MGTYLLVEEQSGGCDYTIGCGVRTTVFEAESMDAALALVRRNALESEDGPGSELLDSDERERDRARIYEVSNTVAVPLDEMRAEMERWCAEDEERVRAESERAEYERLRAKFDPVAIGRATRNPSAPEQETDSQDSSAIATSVSIRVGPPVTAGVWPRRRS